MYYGISDIQPSILTQPLPNTLGRSTTGDGGEYGKLLGEIIVSCVLYCGPLLVS